MITLLSVRDISREIDRNELDAWQKLLRVLRHEILNSLSPIKLIAGNLSERLQPEGEMVPLERLSEKEAADIKTGLDTIHRRASGLSVFLDAYTNLYRTPEFKPEATEIAPLLQRITGLFKEEAEQLKIHLKLGQANKELELLMDERMIEQVLINLVKNAMEAVKERTSKIITLSASESEQGTIISISDSGAGIH